MTEALLQIDDIAQLLGDHISREILGTGNPVDREQNLLLDGAVDSLGMLKLVAFIEMTYDIKVPPEQFTIENFRSVNVISNYVSSLLI
ncbi:MAG: acyl carrier protein [Thiogranum sp.]